ncbi:MAG: hypothetical protein NZP34_16185, partial [Caldilineales bacterium]|nr:hypothetical protein [Caldilineales bacterium]
WRQIAQTGSIFALAINPASPATLYAGGEWGGVRKSDDGGATWRRSDNGLGDQSDIYALLVNSANPRVIFAGTGNGVYKSEDG